MRPACYKKVDRRYVVIKKYKKLRGGLEPIKYKLALNLLIFSGLRRGEIGGLKWSDIDFDDKIITVKRALKYIAGVGLFEGETKTFKSRRSIKLPDFIFDLFKAYKLKRIRSGNWKNA